MNEPDTFVLIPTANRSHYLETALESVARQTARGRIKEVRVMENGGDRRSEALCARFADRLPIRYVFRQPCLTPLEHGQVIAEEVYPCRYIAILHDDDWWSPDHLGASLDALAANGAVSCFSGYFFTRGERAPLWCDGSLLFWLGSGFQPTTQDWVLDFASVLVSNLGGAPGHYSTIVAEAQAYRECAYTLHMGNEFDNDRLICAALGLKGRMVHRPMPSACIRQHGSQDARRFSNDSQTRLYARSTVWFFELAKENRIDLIKEFQVRLDACPSEHREAVFGRLTVPFLYNLLRGHPRVPKALMDYWTLRGGF
jgi:glycosyltransferase involved in cell wall biosynthesis